MLKKIDFFAAELPKFNIRGDTKINTNIGGCCSFLIIFVVLMYAAFKFNHLITRHNPQVNSYEVRDAYGENDHFETS